MTRDDEPLLECFPLSESKIFFADSAARITFYDTDARCITTTPNLHARKYFPFALSVPSAGPGGEQDGGDGSLYIMDTLLDPKKSFPFEALVCRNHPDDHCTAPKTWHCDTLPLPPFVHDPGYKPATIFCYAVVGDVICISTIGVGTYCFDTVSRTWSPAGDWQMPFYGKAKYVPELKLWFGMSGNNPQLPCAADLSPVLRGHAPKQCYVWGDPDRPEEWLPHRYGSDKIVSLGSGRLCITNFFEVMEGSSRVNDDFGEVIAVFTGLEVLAGNGNGNGSGNGNGLRMIKHKSRILHTNSIESVL